ncbi:hypothetical protein BHYA_0032g00490 [Botrytis hyacinthi]|uniref:Aminoglycoside phosphotransferase domain-containing protein n=1 Tax=Botrytis hyacinthi TaxID=278943 RepID=A0A4Z1GWE3_9HELO|nr:hypothetical protein BHYA_0032g00490 [Botrytis hyacinthi]
MSSTAFPFSTGEGESIFHYIISKCQINTTRLTTAVAYPRWNGIVVLLLGGSHHTRYTPKTIHQQQRLAIYSSHPDNYRTGKNLLTIDDEDEVEDAQDARILAERLLKLVPSIFSTAGSIPEQFVLFHDDSSLRDILADNGGTIARILDWDCVFTLPAWKACVFPV